MVAWRRLDDIPRDALPWLLACARSSLGNHRRAERRRRRLVERLRPARADAQPAALRDTRLATALGQLSTIDQEVLLLTAWEGLSVEQAAAVLGCSSQAFRVRSHRARRRLAAALEVPDPAPTPLTTEAQ